MHKHPHANTLPLHSLVELMSRIALMRDPQAAQLSLDDLRACLRYVEPLHAEAARLIQRGLGEALTLAAPGASAQDLHRLFETALPSERMPADDDLRRLLQSLARRYPEGFLIWQPGLAPQGQPQGWYSPWYGPLLDAVNAAAPGQAQAAHEIARGLALQLDNPERSRPGRLLLSGPEGAGARQMARAIAAALQAEGYAALELELSQIRCDEEAAELDGSKPYWKGSRPGKLTAFVHRHPKAVVILHDLDRTLPAVQASLLPALRDGVLVDNHGLGERSREQREQGSGLAPTPVDMGDAVLIFTSSSGHEEAWSQPDFAELLDQPDADLRDLRATVLAAMRSAEQVHRSERSALFDLACLAHLENDLVLLRPLRWAALLALAGTILRQAAALAQQQLRRAVTVEAASADAIALAYVAGFGGSASLDQLTPERMAQALFTPLSDALFAASRADGQPLDRAGVELRMPAAAAQRLNELLQPLGADPMRQMQRRRLSLRCDSTVSRSANGGTSETWVLALTHPRLVQVREAADYGGIEGALTAIVPKLGFADVAGHDSAKAHLQEVIALYRQADLHRAQGIALPRGCVLYGPPGSGKTMLAQAFAAEAGMAFIAVTGTDLLNPERVRQIFALAQRNAPSAVFIDEIDALGRRGSKSASHDAAINRLLASIQGFDERAPIFVLAATNRPKLLDDALTRPGRLDHSIYIGKLDRSGRLPMVRKLLALLPAGLDEDDTAQERLLSFSHGLTGAALSQVLRECRLLQLRRGAGSALSLDDLIEQLQRQKYGAKGDAQRDPGLRERVAFHEAGHAVLHGLFFPELPIEQVTITARGDAEGFMAVNPETSVRLDETPERVRKFMAVLLGGRLAEQRRYGPEQGPSSGSAGDFARAREAAFKAVAHHGLDVDWGLLSLAGMDEEDRALLPDQIKADLWQRIRAWLVAAQDLAHLTLHRHWAEVEQLAAELLAQDYVAGSRVRDLLASPARAKAKLIAA